MDAEVGVSEGVEGCEAVYEGLPSFRVRLVRFCLLTLFGKGNGIDWDGWGW